MKNSLLTIAATLLIPVIGFTQATLISQFDFSGNFADAQGNGAVVGYANVSANLTPTTYNWVSDSFGNGGGLLLSIPDAVFTEDNYSIAIDFSFSNVNGYRKIIDFDRLGSDQGLYVNTNIRLYSAGSFGTTTLNANQYYTVVVTRNGITDSARAYLLLNGNVLNLESACYDSNNAYVADSISGLRVFHLFHDDTLTSSEFSISGSVNQIRVWNGVVALSDVAIVGIAEQTTTDFAALYPNPAANYTRISFDTPSTGVINITNATGQLVYSAQICNASSAEINTESWPAGIYIVQVNELRMKLVKN